MATVESIKFISRKQSEYTTNTCTSIM